MDTVVSICYTDFQAQSHSSLCDLYPSNHVGRAKAAMSILYVSTILCTVY